MTAPRSLFYQTGLLFFSVVILLLLCTFLSAPVQAQDEATIAPPTNRTAKTDAPKEQLRIPVWVESDDADYWLEGQRQNFKVFIEDREVAIRGFQHPRSGTIILIVFDTVDELALVDQARNALQDASRGLSAQYWLGLLRAQNGLSVLQEPTADRAQLAARIKAIEIGGKAGLLDTLEPVAQLATAMLDKASVRLSVLYITDSAIQDYRADYLNPVINSSDSGDLSRRFSDRAVQEKLSRLAEALAGFTVPLYVLHLERRSDPLNLAYQSGLERIAADSGGLAVFCRTVDEIRPSLASIIKRIQSGYVLTTDLPATRRASVRLRVEAQSAAGKNFARVTHINQVSLKKN